jgi:hypothetical protein
VKPNLMAGPAVIGGTVKDPWAKVPQRPSGAIKYVKLDDRNVSVPYAGERPYGFHGPFRIERLRAYDA